MAGKVRVALCVGKPADRAVLQNLGARFPELEIRLVCASIEELLATNATLAYEIDVVFIDTVSVKIPWSRPLSETLGSFHDAQVVATLAIKQLSMQARLQERGVSVVLPAPYNVAAAATAITQAAAKRVTRAAEPAPAAPRTGTVLAVYAPKGGAGATHLAANLAIALQRHGRGAVALVDMALEFADQHSTLPSEQPAAQRTIRDLADELDHIDANTLTDQIMRTDPSGIHVLYGPRTLAEGQNINGTLALRMLEHLVDHFSWIVVDLASDLTNENQVTTEVLAFAGAILLVVTLDAQQLRTGRRFVEFLRRASFDEKRVIAVADRADPGASGLAFERADEALGMPILAQICSDARTVRTAENEGKPFMATGPERPIAHDVRRLALLLDQQLRSRTEVLA